MNVTGDLPQIVQTFGSVTLPAIVKTLTDAGQSDLAQLLQAFHEDVGEIAAAGNQIVDKVLAGLAGERKELCSYLDARLNGLKLTSTLTFPNVMAQPDPEGQNPQG